MSDFRAWRREYANEWPCTRDCVDRKQGCHSTCKKYEDAKKANDKKKADLRAKREIESAVDAYCVKRAIEVSGKKLKER